MSQLQETKRDVIVRMAMERQFLNVDKKSFQRFFNKIKGMRIKNDQTTLWATISNAGTDVNVFQ